MYFYLFSTLFTNAIVIIFSLKMDGESLDKVLDSSQKDGLTAVLFYAAWCPFSSRARQVFSTLSSMFPQIKHVMVEQSATRPRYIYIYIYFSYLKFGGCSVHAL